MYRLELDATLCINCGTCMDLCPPRAIDMKVHGGECAVEGAMCLYLLLSGPGNPERPRRAMMTFPFLARPAACDGCGVCVRECAVGALDVLVPVNTIKYTNCSAR